MKRLGIIGGLGSETSCKFCLIVNTKIRDRTDQQPHILLDNLPVSKKAEDNIIRGISSDEHLRLLKDSIRRLNDLDADLLVIPCNTVHVFIVLNTLKFNHARILRLPYDINFS